MDKAFCYILGQLHDGNKAVKLINKTLKRQAKFNKNVAVTNLFISVYILLNEARWLAQKDMNNQLRKELDALKQTKGE